ncbi:MAG TPA: long-chain fatty acid--CoA ligase [Allosphingosinicella sp.]|nr:long-chain fatty acid--CoA ligase [Allosphingosinicella sp.]
MLGAMQDWPLRVMRLLDYAEREHATREIVSRWADGSTTRTNYAGLARDSRKLAQALERLGIRRGDRVATLAMNHSRHIAAWYGTIGMGGVIHTVNPRLFSEQLVYIFNHAEDRVLFYDHAFRPLIDALRPHLKTVEHYFCFDGPDGEFEPLIAAESGDYRWAEGDEREPCMLCYTSGTTGNPKGVLYEHRSTVIHAMAEVQPDVLGIGRRAIAMPIVPMFHAAAWGLPFAAPIAGCKLVCTADYTPKAVCDLMHEEGVTHTAAVPTVWLALMQYVEQTGRDLGNLKTVTIGGSAAPRAMIEFFETRGVAVAHAWGMTEMSPIGTVGARPHDWDELSFEAQIDIICKQGRVPFGVELRVVDDQGREQPRDGKSSGSLQVRGPWVIKRYYKETEDATGAEGWFDTGDVAVIHPDGVMQITDRAKDVIKSGGEWISSIELENAAMSCPGVAEAAAVGVAHPKWDERPILLVVRKEGADISASAIQQHLTAHVAKWWLPDEILFVDSLPHTATGKLLKTALREQYRTYQLQVA